MPLDKVLSLSPELPVLQDPLDLILLVVIDHNWWGIGLHSIILIGLEKFLEEDIVDTSQRLPVASSSEVQVINCEPYPLGNGEGSNLPVMQVPGVLQFQVPSA